MINIVVEVHVLSNQMLKIDFVRLVLLVPYERRKAVACGISSVKVSTLAQPEMRGKCWRIQF